MFSLSDGCELKIHNGNTISLCICQQNIFCYIKGVKKINNENTISLKQYHKIIFSLFIRGSVKKIIKI